MGHERLGSEDKRRLVIFTLFLRKMNSLALAVFGIFILPQDCVSKERTANCNNVRPKGLLPDQFDCLIQAGTSLEILIIM